MLKRGGDSLMAMDKTRLAVIDNIRAALAEGNSFAKVEIGDPQVTDEDVKRVIEPFDTLRRNPINKIKAHIARRIAERETEARNKNTKIVGLENIEGIKGGAIITCNHFNVMDNTIPRILAMKAGKAKKFDIVVQETNIFMEGFFGFLMKNANTLPVSRSASYMAKNLKPALKSLLGKGHFILIYPEQEMWFNYKKPRELRDGAYHYAAEFGVPIIPCFVTMENLDTVDAQGFFDVAHTLHVMPPIYPDSSLSVRENRIAMHERDRKLKLDCYERTYGYPVSCDFDPVRDIAGYRPETQ